MKESSFVSDCINGKASWHMIDDYIDKWHQSGTDQSIVEYLGITSEEYSCFVKDHSSIEDTISGYVVLDRPLENVCCGMKMNTVIDKKEVKSYICEWCGSGKIEIDCEL
jgi:hypothetical protein